MSNCLNIIEEENGITFENTIQDVMFYNRIIKITTDEEKEVSVTSGDDITVPSDGWFKIIRIGIPTTYKNEYALNIYVWKDSNIYKRVQDNVFQKVTLQEVLEINPRTTNLYYSEVEVFNTGNLKQCLLKKNQNSEVSCSSVSDPCNSNNCIRNHIWHILNIIDYYVNCGCTIKAQQLLEKFNKCFNFCSTNQSCHCLKKCKCNG